MYFSSMDHYVQYLVYVIFGQRNTHFRATLTGRQKDSADNAPLFHSLEVVESEVYTMFSEMRGISTDYGAHEMFVSKSV